MSENIFREGIYGINKIKGVSSFDVIGYLRRISGIRKIGHAGTLDPLASGVLVVAIGKEYTKKISELVKQEKEYIALVNLGVNSETDDEEGEKEIINVKKIPNKNNVKKVIDKFIGEIEQTPPLYSSIKINGKPAYKYARKGKKIDIKSRKIQIKEIDILNYEYPLLKLRIVCGSGTYIRSLAYDIGMELKTGAYLKELIRTRVGNYLLENCIELKMETRKF